MKNLFVYSRQLLPVICIVILVAATEQSSFGQIAIPDKPSAKRFEQLLEVINEGDEESRNKLIREIFAGSDEQLENIFVLGKKAHSQLVGVTFQKETVNTDKEYGGVCLSKRGVTLVVSVEIAGDRNLIADVTIEEYEEEEDLKAADGFFPVIVDGKSNPKARGVWQAKGYGYLIEITENEIRAYNYTGKFGWQIEFADNILFRPGDETRPAQGTLHPLEPGYALTKLSALPAVCQKQDWTPTETFDAFVDVMSTHYPFFKERKINWQARTKEQRPKVNDDMTEEELFEAMSAMLKNLHDGHVSLSATIGDKDVSADIGSKGTSLSLRKAFANQDKFESKASFYSNFVTELKAKIKADVLGGAASLECNDQLLWGRAHDKVGYIYISGMYGYGPGGMTKQVEALHLGMNKILSELADTEALIIDISLNPGGTDAISVELARHFADKKRLGFSKWPAEVKDYRNDRFVTPYSETGKDAVRYTKPVFVLQNDLSASAAEIFTMCMRACPNVVTVGQPTEGVLSDVLDKTLPNGWDFGISNEVYVDHEGICYEGPGIPPQIEIKVFEDDIMNHDHSLIIDKIVKMALEKSAKQKSN